MNDKNKINLINDNSIIMNKKKMKIKMIMLIILVDYIVIIKVIVRY